MKKLLVLGASLYQLDVIEAGLELGHEVLTLDNRPSNPGHKRASKSFIVDTTDKEAVLEVARKESIDGVIAFATDVALQATGYLVDEMDLVGPSFSAAETLTEKLRFRALLEELNLPSPRSFEVKRGQELPVEIGAGEQWIVKPDRASGSRGIKVCSGREEITAQIEEAATASLNGKVLVEEFINGVQGTLEGVMSSSKVVLPFFLDRETVELPYVATAGHCVPTELSSGAQARVIESLEKAFASVGCGDGPFDCDFVVSEEGEVYLLEIAPRVGGNSIRRLILESTGFDFASYAVRHCLGESATVPTDISIAPTALSIFGVSAKGKLAYREEAVEELRGEDWVRHLTVDKSLGEEVTPFVDGRSRLGECVIRMSTRSELQERILFVKEQLNLKGVRS